MKSQSGFTLLETLLALVLMSLLMVALFGGFRAGIASWRVADGYIEQSEPQVVLNRLLYRHMSRLVLQVDGDFWNEQANNLQFMGHGNRIRYVAPLALALDNQAYSIELAGEPGGREGVWIKYVPYDERLDMQQELDTAEYMQVAADLTISFSYFIDGDWVSDLEEGVIPRLVRVHWASGARVWSDSIFRVNRINEAG
jgi:prepilin-type N-terminal cleavage/methylation domain-containing protein